MSPELQKKLYEDFPSLYRDKDKSIRDSEIAACCGELEDSGAGQLEAARLHAIC